MIYITQYLSDGIRKHRDRLMGVAILLVMVCHTTFCFPGVLQSVYEYFAKITQCGVDIFLLASGFGCYYSLSHNNDVKGFYLRRAIRIIPTYVFIIVLRIIIDCIINSSTFLQCIHRYSLISFFTDQVNYVWYIAAILLLYIAYPAIYSIQTKNKRGIIVLISLFYLATIGLEVYGTLSNIEFGWNRLFLVRVPGFLLGSFLGGGV